MLESDFKLEILEKYFPDECEIMGPTYLEEIIHNKVDYDSAEGGSYIDLEVIIAVLVGAVELIEKGIKAYNFLKEKRKDKLTCKEIEEKTESMLILPSEINDDLRKTIYQEIYNEFHSSNK